MQGQYIIDAVRDYGIAHRAYEAATAAYMNVGGFTSHRDDLKAAMRQAFQQDQQAWQRLVDLANNLATAEQLPT
jgi:hypothetical protein